MIVELCNTDLLSLVNGSQVAIGDLIVRPTEADASNVTGVAPKARPERRERGNRRTDGPRRPRKTGAHVIASKFRENGCAASGCNRSWGEGERMIYDYDARKPYCLAHGAQRFPELASEAAE
jgi:hypothetical protein